MTTWPTASAVLATAKSLIGTGESPDGSNHNFITEAYGIGDGPWCAMAVWYAFNQNGYDFKADLTPEFAWTPSAVAAAKQRGWWHDGLDGVQPGDPVFFNIPGGADGGVNHVAIWEGNGTTIDGNWGNQECEVQHDLSQVVGYIAFPFSAEPAAPEPKGPPTWPGEYLRLQDPMLHDDNVRAWQQRMADRGWTIAVDGWYGPQSDNVCRSFQIDSSDHGWPLTADGIVGPKTWAATWVRPVS